MTIHSRGARFRRTLAPAALALLLGAAPLALAAQAAPELGSLRPSSAPAFLLLGVAPSAVERPTTPADFGFSLLNRTQLLTSLPQDFALEASPYWFGSHRRLAWRDDITRNPLESLARTATLSLATAQLGTRDPPSTGLAVGVRASLLSGWITREAQDTLAEMEKSLAREGSIYFEFAASRLAELEADWRRDMEIAARTITDQDALRAVQESLTERHQRRSALVQEQVLADPAYRRRIAEERARFQNFALAREGPMLEVAAGAAWDFPGQIWDAGRFHRYGVWATFGWETATPRAGRPRITPIATLRFLGQAEDAAPDILDAGGRLVLSGEGYGFSLEGVLRSFLGAEAPENLFRVAGIAEYQVSRDTWLLASFGRDHESPSEGSLIAQFGLKFNFAGERYMEGPGNGQ